MSPVHGNNHPAAVADPNQLTERHHQGREAGDVVEERDLDPRVFIEGLGVEVDDLLDCCLDRDVDLNCANICRI